MFHLERNRYAALVMLAGLASTLCMPTMSMADGAFTAISTERAVGASAFGNQEDLEWDGDSLNDPFSDGVRAETTDQWAHYGVADASQSTQIPNGGILGGSFHCDAIGSATATSSANAVFVANSNFSMRIRAGSDGWGGGTALAYTHFEVIGPAGTIYYGDLSEDYPYDELTIHFVQGEQYEVVVQVHAISQDQSGNPAMPDGEAGNYSYLLWDQFTQE